jgi:trimeric autotransporter adhesin
MKLLIKLKITALLVIPLVLACLTLLPSAQAVVPAPDGGYGGFNTAEGQNSLFSLSGGVWNTAIGGQALHNDTSGSANTAVGLNALYHNNGPNNTAVGAQSLVTNAGGANNVAMRFQALMRNSSGSANVAIGLNALLKNTVGVQNTAVGTGALNSNGASGNVAVGFQAASANTSGNENTVVGYQALHANIITQGNSALGDFALTNFNGPTSGPFGDGFNTAIGSLSMMNATAGSTNVAVGRRSLESLLTGSDNVALGWRSGDNFTGAESGNVVIGALLAGVTGQSNQTWIRNINTTSQPTASTLVDFVTVRLSDGRLGHVASSRRYKEDIKPMDDASEVLYRLTPVTYRYKKDIDPDQNLDYGLVAEEVAQVNPKLAVRDGNGQIESVRYTAIYNMMLNEFLKEHKKVQELEATVAQQQKGMDALVAQVKEQAAQI